MKQQVSVGSKHVHTKDPPGVDKQCQGKIAAIIQHCEQKSFWVVWFCYIWLYSGKTKFSIGTTRVCSMCTHTNTHTHTHTHTHTQRTDTRFYKTLLTCCTCFSAMLLISTFRLWESGSCCTHKFHTVTIHTSQTGKPDDCKVATTLTWVSMREALSLLLTVFPDNGAKLHKQKFLGLEWDTTFCCQRIFA